MSRYSKQRATILQVLRATTSHPTAEAIYEQAKKVVPRLSLGTVYRNLKQLLERGEIQQLELDAAFARYDGNPQSHGHFLCQSCGQVLDLDTPEAGRLQAEIAERTGLKVLDHRLAFYGLCLDCQEKARV